MNQSEVLMKIRQETGLGVMDIKKALDEAGGDEQKALKLLKNKRESIVAKKQERTAGQGLIETYTHQGRIGVMIEVNCETDFVARNEDFIDFVHNLVLQISSMCPQNVNELLKQESVKDSTQTVEQLLTAITAKMGEKVVISRFVRWEIGEMTV